jgi:hypothetical protein
MIRMVRDNEGNNEILSPSKYFFGNDEAYPLQNYTGNPEFEMFNREAFSASDPKEYPELTFMTNLPLNELAPIQNEYGLDY